MLFPDRAAAGRRLGAALHHLRGERPVVLALPRGGVPVGVEVAAALDAPLDVVVVRKLGAPFEPELAMGAVGENGAMVVNDDVVRFAGVSREQLAAAERRERAEVERRAERFRAGRPPVPLRGRTVVVVDDGVATGSTARAACQVVRAQGAARVVLALPVAPPGVPGLLEQDADEVVCAETPEPFFAIGQWYGDFTQVGDEQVVDLLHRDRPTTPAGGRPPGASGGPPAHARPPDVR